MAVWQSLRSSSRAQNVFTTLLAGAVSSELMWIIKMRQEREEIDRKTNTQIELTQSILSRLQKGEKLDVDKELLTESSRLANEPVEAIMKHLESVEEQWASAKPGPKSGPKAPEPPANIRTDVSDSSKKSPKDAGSSRFL